LQRKGVVSFHDKIILYLDGRLVSRRGWLADSPADGHDSSLEERAAGDDESIEPIEEEVEDSLEPPCYWFRVFQSHHQMRYNHDGNNRR
jgi:hypothetical protein